MEEETRDTQKNAKPRKKLGSIRRKKNKKAKASFESKATKRKVNVK